MQYKQCKLNILIFQGKGYKSAKEKDNTYWMQTSKRHNDHFSVHTTAFQVFRMKILQGQLTNAVT